MSVSLSSILNIATSGLEVAQTGLNTVSNNISNVNTAGYVREVVNQQSVAVGGQGIGVSVADIARTTNAYLEAANQKATADGSSASVSSSYLDQASSLFGDPTSASSFFGQLDSVFSAFSTLSSSPSATAQAAAVGQVSQFLSASQSIGASLGQLSGQADSQITSDVGTVNGLLSQISKLNSSISQATVSGQDATGAQNQQSALITQLSGLMNVTVSPTSTGGVTVKASDGTVLAGDQGAATLSYDGSGAMGQVQLTPVGGGATQVLGARLTSGELAGLVDLRNTQLPSITGQLAELTSQTAATLNQVSNSYSSVPAPSTLTGRNTGMDLATDVSNFTGKTTVGVVNGSGVLQTGVAIDFSAGTMTVGGGAPVSFTPSSFLSTLNSQLGGAATASFSNGALSISAAGGGSGVVIADDAATPAAKAGQGFSQFFGLNDLVSGAPDYDTGLTVASASGYPAGQSISFNLAGADGSALKTVTVQTPSGGAMSDLLGALNSPHHRRGALRRLPARRQGRARLHAHGRVGRQPVGDERPDREYGDGRVDDGAVRARSGGAQRGGRGAGGAQRHRGGHLQAADLRGRPDGQGRDAGAGVGRHLGGGCVCDGRPGQRRLRCGGRGGGEHVHAVRLCVQPRRGHRHQGVRRRHRGDQRVLHRHRDRLAPEFGGGRQRGPGDDLAYHLPAGLQRLGPPDLGDPGDVHRADGHFEQLGASMMSPISTAALFGSLQSNIGATQTQVATYSNEVASQKIATSLAGYGGSAGALTALNSLFVAAWRVCEQR